MNGSGEQESLGVVPVVQNQEQVSARLQTVCANLFFGFSGVSALVQALSQGNHSAQEPVLCGMVAPPGPMPVS